jgi:hypothetical protein
MADYSLALNVKPLQLEDPLTSYSKFAAIQNAQNQNALAQYQLAAAQRAEAQQNALYEQAQMPGFKLDFSNALRYGAPGIAAYKAQREAETQGLQAEELRGKIAAQPGARLKTEAETNKTNQEIRDNQTKALGVGLMQAMQNPDDNTLKNVFDRLESTGIPTATLRAQFEAMPDLEQRKQVIKNYALSNKEGREALQFTSPKPETFDFGGRKVSFDMNPNSPTYKQEILSQEKTPTPDAVMADARLKAQHIDQLAHWNDLTDIQRQQLKRQYNADALQDARSRAQLAETIANNARVDRREAERIAQANNPAVVATTLTDAAGNVTKLNKFGQPVGEVMPGVGKPSATFEKTAAQKKQLGLDLDRIIPELENAVKPGGLIERSTGSGIGKLADETRAFFGYSSEGAIAAGQLQPIYDMVLKTVPRFEGPQSNADTKSYERAAGDIGNPAIPAPRKLAAAKEILRLLKARKDQFVTRDIAEGGGLAPSGGGAAPSTPGVVDFGSLK